MGKTFKYTLKMYEYAQEGYCFSGAELSKMSIILPKPLNFLFGIGLTAAGILFLRI